MSGAAGGSRITRSAVEQTVKDYTENILTKIEGFTDARLSGSINRPGKDDFGDIDIIVTVETGDDKKTVKKKIADLFQALPDSELPPLQNPKYKGKKFINHGEMISNLYPISGMPGEFVQIDNIIALSSDEGAFKKTILDYPAELQGVILGLVKTPLLEEEPKDVFARMGIKDIPEAEENEEYEFHIDTTGLTLRLVIYGANFKILGSNTIWQSKTFADVKKLLKNFNLDGSFNELIEQVKNLKSERSRNRVKGFFKKSIKVGAAEQGTPKGDVKQRALDTVDTLQESRALLTRARLATKYLDEDEKSRIAVFPGAFKPPHKDHIARIKAASEKVGEGGKVIVIISPLPREKKGQETISAKQAVAVFDLYKNKGEIPDNVTYVISTENSPVAAAYKEFESDKTQPYIAVFGKDDKARFSNIEDKLPNVVVDSFEEAGVGDTSATDLRTAIANRDKELLTDLIPSGATAEEYLNALGIREVQESIEENSEGYTNPWEAHADMLAKVEKKPELLKGLWKSISKPSRKALVLYYRAKREREEVSIDEPVEEVITELNEGKGRKLRVFDFDDTLVHVNATIHITHEDGSKEGLNPAEYAVYEPQPGDRFDFSEFNSVIRKANPLRGNVTAFLDSYNNPTEKTTILTARLLGYPVKKYFRDEYNIEPYVIGLGSSDPQEKADWIESQIKKGYTDVEFRDDSVKNVEAVAALQGNYPEVRLVSTLVTEQQNIETGKLNENATYSKEIDIKEKIKQLTQHMLDKGYNIEPLPEVIFQHHDYYNARNFLGKTAYYNPNNNTITLYTEGRHPKDIVRSFAHEMIHHIQNLEGRLGDIEGINTMEDDNLNDIEAEANLKGTMTFRNWTDSLNEGGADTEWIDMDGSTLTLQNVLDLTKNIPVKNYPTEKLAKIVLNWDNNPSEIERITQVEVSNQYPILIMADEDGSILWILDGNHRAQKALRSNLKTIPAKIIKPSDLDDNARKVLGVVARLRSLNEKYNYACKCVTGLSEVGDAKHTPYRWTKSISTTRMGNVRTVYKFKTSLDTPYQVDYNVTLGGDKSLMGFRVEHESFNQVTNKGEMFEVMSTVIDTTKDFLQNNPEVNQLTVEPTKNNEQDNRRAKLYNSYVEKNIPKGWSFTSNNDEIVLSRDDVGNLKEVMQSVTDDMVVVLSREDNALDLYDTVTKESLGYINVYQNAVTGVAAKKGYGPLMYELGMAYVYPKPLRSDRSGNTADEAQNIWEKFIEGINPNIKVIKLTPQDKKFATHYPNENEIWEPESNFYNYEFYNPNKSQVDELITKGSLLTKEEQEHIIKVGDEFYHKLVRENKHTPTLNKDPFGLNAYARELATGLEELIDKDEVEKKHGKKVQVKEGAFDTITTQVSSEIFNNWKQQFDEDNTLDTAFFGEDYDLVDRKGRQLEFNLEANLEFVKTEERIYTADGGADPGDEEEYDSEGNIEDPGLVADILLNFQVDPRALPRIWSTISMDIKDIIRHEIEHLTQTGYNVITSKRLPDDTVLRNKVQLPTTLSKKEYYILDKEVPAMLQGMYFKAKKMKKPFKDVVKTYLDSRNVSQEDQEEILKRWKPAAKKLNLPDL